MSVIQFKPKERPKPIKTLLAAFPLTPIERHVMEVSTRFLLERNYSHLRTDALADFAKLDEPTADRTGAKLRRLMLFQHDRLPDGNWWGAEKWLVRALRELDADQQQAIVDMTRRFAKRTGRRAVVVAFAQGMAVEKLTARDEAAGVADAGTMGLV